MNFIGVLNRLHWNYSNQSSASARITIDGEMATLSADSNCDGTVCLALHFGSGYETVFTPDVADWNTAIHTKFHGTDISLATSTVTSR